MRVQTLFASAFLALLAVPVAGNAQGVPGGVAHGMHEGSRYAGPVGAVVGGAVGGVIGGVEGVLGINHRYDNYVEAPPRTYRKRRAVKKTVRYSRTRYRY